MKKKKIKIELEFTKSQYYTLIIGLISISTITGLGGYLFSYLLIKNVWVSIAYGNMMTGLITPLFYELYLRKRCEK